MLDDKLAGHNKHCPKCDNHLTSLYLCPECGVRYDEWYKADQRIAELEEKLKDCVYYRE
jgi:tRNA(Ile2) C34 agmatinyltransferase TiaS